MSTTKKKKTAREKRVLIASLIVAGAIVAGSTFAWFTSKDEVTNRLSASADYNVSIAEDFQPPEDWVPGQSINKDVSAVNTGNVDAFVRMWLEGEMSVFNRTTLADAEAVPAATSANYMNEVVDADKNKLGFNFYAGSGDNIEYYRELSTLQRKNPDLNGSDHNEETNSPATFSEVQSVQAGGYLVYAPTGAEWTYTTEQETEITNDSNNKEVVAKGKVIGSKNATGTPDAKLNVESGCAIDASTFKPKTEGLYIFRRNVTLETTAGTVDTYEYSGYYFVPADASTNLGLAAAKKRDVYLALYNDTTGKSYNTLPAGSVTPATSTPDGEVTTVTPGAIKFDTAKETVVKNSGLTWTYTAASGTDPAKLTATYPGADGKIADDAATTTVDETQDNIVIDIALDNIGTAGQTWTAKTATGKTTTFYYNDDVEAGDTTTKLVDSVKLADATTQYAFLAFDFDLNVFLESIQVTINESGQETTEPITAKWAATGDIVEAGTETKVEADEIANINWV